MKNHLVNLLLEAYKLSELERKLAAMGIDASHAFGSFDIAEIVFDIIGFPEDNTLEYSWKPIAGIDDGEKEYRIVNGQKVELRDEDENLFARDWLNDKLFEVFTDENNRKITINEDGYFLNDIDLEKVKANLSEFVDWLYNELEEWKNEKK
ncbi:MAG: hypothetical protein MUF71_15405 [Candidatus Kapabacteria bacterium]|nr:hypothetical protein [Candidatus Kapabacteria bacterium]